MRLRARRARLAQREREAYQRERDDVYEDEPAAEPIEPAGQPIEPAAEPVEPVAEPVEPAVEPTEAAPQPTESVETPRPSRERVSRRSAKRATRRARRRRRLGLRRPDLSGLRSASTSGARATVRQTTPAVRRLVETLGRALAWLLAWPLRLAGLIERAITGLLAAIASLAGRALELVERNATLERVLVVVTGAAAGCLVYSQFVAYRGVEVGQPDYSQVSTIAPPPQTSRIDAGAAHAYVLVPLAVIAFAIAVAALLSQRWRLGRLVSVIGLVGIAISLAIDLPKGLDAGTAGLAFAGAKATLTEGFYAQLAASAVLVLCGLLLGADPRGSATGVKRRKLGRGPARPGRRAASVAGGGA